MKFQAVCHGALGAVLSGLLLVACEAPPPELNGLQIAIVPASPGPEDALIATVVAHSNAWDTEDFSYTYRWTRDEEEVPGQPTRTIPAELTGAGETWSVEVTPELLWDEELLLGERAADSVAVESPEG